eukprot:Trichotokara_eunicae@DN5086_c0_g1_i5.p1
MGGVGDQLRYFRGFIIETIGRGCAFFFDDDHKSKKVTPFFVPKNICWNIHPLPKGSYLSCEVPQSSWEQECTTRAEKVNKALKVNDDPPMTKKEGFFKCGGYDPNKYCLNMYDECVAFAKSKDLLESGRPRSCQTLSRCYLHTTDYLRKVVARDDTPPRC